MTSPLSFMKTRSGRYSVTADGYRYTVTKHDTACWGLSIQRTITVVDVEIGDPDHRPHWTETETLRDAKVIAQAFADLHGVQLGIRSRFAVAIERAYDILMVQDAAR